ncbi:MAG: DUF2892 domain-containing protein [Verrucomicrobia bacterium]|nr:DUF2892 domain-containing protein [Verrucomicrobiota bacterium]
MHADFPASSGATPNVGTIERWVCGVGGGALVAYGAMRKSWVRYALVGTGLALAYRGIRGHCGLYGALGINTADHSASATTCAVVTIERAPAEIYAYLKQPDHLPLLTGIIHDLRAVGESEYQVRAQTRKQDVAWHISLTADRENEFIAWRAFSEGRPGHTGQLILQPAPGNRGTEVEIQIQQEGAASPAGVIADHAAAQGWRARVNRALHQLKQQIEAGEICSIDGQPAGQRSPLGRVLSPNR